MYQIAEKTRTLLLATATPVQLRPVEAWDLLDILSRGDDSVLGNIHSFWRRPSAALKLIMERSPAPKDENMAWEWVRNPLPPKSEHHDFEILRRQLNINDTDSVVRGDLISELTPPARSRLNKLFPRLVKEHNPFIRRIIRRTRNQLESQIDLETKEPLLDPIGVELYGESPHDAIRLPPYLKEAYELAEKFCHMIGQRLKGAGFLKTLLLRRMGSSLYAGYMTAKKMLETWETIDTEYEYEEDLFGDDDTPRAVEQTLSKTLIQTSTLCWKGWSRPSKQTRSEIQNSMLSTNASLNEGGWSSVVSFSASIVIQSSGLRSYYRKNCQPNRLRFTLARQHRELCSTAVGNRKTVIE